MPKAKTVCDSCGGPRRYLAKHKKYRCDTCANAWQREFRAENPTYAAERKAANAAGRGPVPKGWCRTCRAPKTKTAGGNLVCAPCRRAAEATYNRKHPGVKRSKDARYYAKNSGAIAVQSKARYEGKTVEQRAKINKKARARAKTPEGRFAYLRHMHNHSKKPHREVFLSYEEYCVAADAPCFYCNGRYKGGGGGLDRIDNSKGYDVDNVVACCVDCNRLRGDHLTVEETRIAVAAVKAARGESVPGTWPRVTVQMTEATTWH